MDVLVFVHVSLVVIPLLACVRLINREKETIVGEAKDMGIVARILTTIGEYFKS